MNPWSCLWTNIWPGRPLFFISSHIEQMGYWVAWLFLTSASLKGLEVFYFFLLLPNFMAKTQNPLCMTRILRNSQFHQWLTSWVMTEIKCCSAPSKLSRSISIGWSSSGLSASLSLSQQLEGNKRCPETPFCFGLDWQYALPVSQLLMRTSGQARFRLTRFGRLVLFSSSKRTV